MTEAQLLNLALVTGDPSTLDGLDAAYFPAWGPVYQFIRRHLADYGQMPDRVTVLTEFPDFPSLDVRESRQYLIEKLREEVVYARLRPILTKAAEQAGTNSLAAVEYLQQALSDLGQETGIIKAAFDLVGGAAERRAEYIERAKRKGLLGITTGLPTLDETIHGYCAGEVIVFGARQGEGKSWMLLHQCLAAWRAGFRVLLLSLEMNRTQVGFRFDTLNGGWSNVALMKGRLPDASGYNRYLDDLTGKQGLILYTGDDNGSKLWTPTDLEAVIRRQKPDLVAIDHLSLMGDSAGTRDKRERMVNLTRELKLLAQRRNIPIIEASQANRDAVKDNRKDSNATPDVIHLAESDTVGQDADVVIMMRQLEEGMMKLSVRKNRFGLQNVEVVLRWDVDKGDIAELTGEALF